MSGAALREPWPTLERQREAATLGMWIFLASEVLFFGGMFLCYAVARATQPGFLTAAGGTNIWFGSANTLLLLTSSFTMAVASRGADAKLRRLTHLCMTTTAALGVAFLIVKGFEYREDIENHFWPGALFAVPGRGAQLFFALYWVMTAVHAVHLAIGIVLVGRLAALTARGGLDLASPEIRATALYWALVDVIWLVLYALLYLGDRS